MFVSWFEMAPSAVRCYLVSPGRQAVCWAGLVQVNLQCWWRRVRCSQNQQRILHAESLNRNRQETKLFIDPLTWPPSKTASPRTPGAAAMLLISVLGDFAERNEHEREAGLCSGSDGRTPEPRSADSAPPPILHYFFLCFNSLKII